MTKKCPFSFGKFSYEAGMDCIEEECMAWDEMWSYCKLLKEKG